MPDAKTAREDTCDDERQTGDAKFWRLHNKRKKSIKDTASHSLYIHEVADL